jgi:hypothetical protein
MRADTVETIRSRDAERLRAMSRRESLFSLDNRAVLPSQGDFFATGRVASGRLTPGAIRADAGGN